MVPQYPLCNWQICRPGLVRVPFFIVVVMVSTGFNVTDIQPDLRNLYGYMVTPPPPVGVWGPSCPCGVVVGFWGLGLQVKSIRLRVDLSLGRVWV